MELGRRRLVATGASLGLAALAGCSGVGPFGRSGPERRVGPTYDPDPGSWPRRHYSALYDRHNPHAGPPRVDPGERWRVDAAGDPTLVVADRTVYVGDDASLRALVAADGSERWHRDGAARVLAALAGRLYVARSTTLAAVDAEGGEETWSHTFDGVVRDVDEHYGVVFVTTPGGVYGLDADTGTRLWSTGSGVGAPLAASFGGVFVRATGRRFERVEPRTTDDRFSTESPVVDEGVSYDRRVPDLPVVSVTDESLYLGGRTAGTSDPGDGIVTRVGSDIGTTKWERRLGRHAHSPAVADGRAYVTVATPGGSRVYALDAGAGETRWRRATDHFVGPAVVAGGTVYVGGSDPGRAGRLHALDAGTGRRLWTRRTAGATATELAAVGDTLYVGDRGSVVATSANAPRN